MKILLLKKILKIFKNKYALITLLILFIALFIFGCKQEIAYLHSDVKNYVVEISYEEETISFQETFGNTDQPDLTVIQKVAAVPVITRNRIFMGITKDGDCCTEITAMDPKNNFKVKNESLPDNSPKVYRTKICDGQSYNYDKTGMLLSSYKMKKISNKEMIQAIKNNGNKLSRGMINLNNPVLTGKKSANDDITEYKPGILRVRKKISAVDNMGSRLIGKTIDYIFEKATNTVLAGGIMDENGKFIYKTSYKYSEDKNNIIPLLTQVESLGKTSDGKDYVYKTIKQTENYKAVVNL